MYFIYAPTAHICSHSDEKPDMCIENFHFCGLYCKITINIKHRNDCIKNENFQCTCRAFHHYDYRYEL